MSLDLTLGLQRAAYPDFGQVHYLVDSDYRTAAQGWSRTDRTGPLDLYEAKKAGRGGTQYVFRTSDYTSDTVAAQAAVDAMVDFRGDVLFWSPGAYSLATVLTVNVPDARWLGRPIPYPTQAGTQITAAVAAAINLTSAADRMEVGFLKFIPLTTSHVFAIDDGADYLYFHDFFYNANGIAADLGTQMVLAAGSMDNSAFNRFVFHTDAAQGPLIELDGTVEALAIQNFLHFHQAGTLAVSLLDVVTGIGSTGIVVGPGHGQIGGSGIVTNLFDHGNMTANATNITIKEFTGSVGYSAAATLSPAAGAAAEADLVSSWIATIGGGAGRAAYTNTA